MFSYGPQLVEFLQGNVDKYTNALVRAVDRVRGDREYPRGDLQQIIVGYVGILAESLLGEKSENRQFYLETVIPGLVANGEDFLSIIYPAVSVSMIISLDVARNFPTETPDELSAYLAEYFATLTCDLSRAALGPASQLNSRR